MPVNQIGGIHLQAPQLAKYLLPFTTSRTTRTTLARSEASSRRSFDGTIGLDARGHRRGSDAAEVPAREGGGPGGAGSPATKPEESPVRPAAREVPRRRSRRPSRSACAAPMLAAIRDSGAARLRAVRAASCEKEYAPQGPQPSPASGRCPTATPATPSRVQQSTTTRMTPEQIHQLGLSRGGAHRGRDARGRADSSASTTSTSFNAAIEANPALQAKSRQQILDLYRQYIDQMRAEAAAALRPPARRPRSRCCRWRSSARRRPRAPSTSRARRTARGRAA